MADMNGLEELFETIKNKHRKKNGFSTPENGQNQNRKCGTETSSDRTRRKVRLTREERQRLEIGTL